METKANFVLIGTATVLGILGLLGLLVWFAKIEVNRQYALYEVNFESVSGLGVAADVRYNGLLVGQVVDLGFDPNDPSKVQVRIEVAADTPIKTDTVAELNSQGVTGVAYVSLTGGSADTALLLDSPGSADIPIIQSRLSVVQTLTEEAPDLVSEAIAAIQEMRSFLGDDNQQAVTNLLSNLESASEELETALNDFSDISQAVSEGTSEISKFTGRLDEIGATVQTTLLKANDTLDVAKLALSGLAPTLTSATDMFTAAEATIGGVDGIVQTQVPQIANDLSAVIASIEAATHDLSGQLGVVLGQFGETADEAAQRIAELEGPIANFDITLTKARASLSAVEEASVSFQGLVDTEGSALVSDARMTLKTVQDALSGMDVLLQRDVPEIVAEVRKAVTSAVGVVDQVGADVTTFTQRLDPLVDTGEETLNAATETLRNANRTLANLDRAMSVTEETLSVAQQAFASAETVISSDLGPVLSDARSAASQFEITMAALSEDIPAITAELRDAMARASAMIDTVDRAVSASAPAVQSFAQTGLPEFSKFARESQQLVYQLEQLTKKLQRDPARFFFGNNIPEFRR